ncbi:MAG: cohesin domain-containing protein [Dehalococcoidia bacterium]
MKKLKPTLTGLILATFLVLALELSTVPVLADGVAVSIDAPDEVGEGSTFTVYVEVGDVVDLSSGQFKISYDNNVIDYVSASAGDFWGGNPSIVLLPFDDPGCIGIAFYDAVAGATTGSGTLIEIDFDVLGTGSDTSYLDLYSHVAFNGLFDDYGDDIPATWADGSVHVTSTTATTPTPTPDGTPSPTETPTSTATPTPNGTPLATDTPTPPDLTGGLLWWHYLLIGLGALIVLVFIVMLFTRRTIS